MLQMISTTTSVSILLELSITLYNRILIQTVQGILYSWLLMWNTNKTIHCILSIFLTHLQIVTCYFWLIHALISYKACDMCSNYTQGPNEY
jgi:hypothetical protein